MRAACFDCIYDLARQDPRVVFIGSDMGTESLQRFKDEMPDRFFMEGVSEANLVGMAVGLAMEGYIPYVTTIAAFLTRRCFEQVLLDVGLHRANVRLVGSGGGLVYAPLGPTHQATDDVALMSLVPGMTVLVPADAQEMRDLMQATSTHCGPIYIRLSMGGEQPVTLAAQEPFVMGKARILRDGRDVLVVTTGIMAQVAMDAAALLHGRGIETTVCHVPTVKPLDTDTIVRLVRQMPLVVIVEEHVRSGGLGSAVVAALVERDGLGRGMLRHCALPDAFTDRYGSHESLLRRYGLTAMDVALVVESTQR